MLHIKLMQLPNQPINKCPFPLEELQQSRIYLCQPHLFKLAPKVLQIFPISGYYVVEVPVDRIREE
jgi:hypothetical protein